MAGKDLKVNVVFNAKTKQLDQMAKKINKMQTKLNRQATAQDRITHAVRRTNKEHAKSGTLIDGLTSKVHRLANAYLGVMAARAAITASDTITSSENKMNYLNNGDTTATQEQLDRMYTSAQKVRMGYSDMMTNVSKSMILAGDAFGGNVDNAIRFQEVMAEAYAVSGATAAEMSSSMYQLMQGLGSGVLQGDELRSVREGATLAYQQIEKYAQGIFGAEKNLKDLASQGLITSEVVVAAMLNAGKTMDEAFNQTKMTFAQAWTMMKNTALMSFKPVLQKMNEVLNSDVGRAIIDGIGKAMQIVASLLMTVFTIVEKVFNFVSNNWGVISKILLTVASILGGVLLYYLGLQIMTIGGVIKSLIQMGATAVTTAIKWVISWATMSLPMLIIIAILAAIVIAVIWVSDSFTDACGNIVGAVFWLGATMWNIVVGVINGIIQFLWTRFVEPWIGIIEWVLNVFNGGFDSFGDAVKNLLGNIISWFLSLGKVVTKIIDAIFGTNWTGGLENLQSSLLSWGKTETAITLDRSAPEIARVSATDAFNKGYGYGAAGGQWITDKVSGIGNKLSGGGLGGGDLALTDLGSTVGDIKGDTGKIAKSTQLTEEDLAYLKNLAHMEWKKEYTTASITIDMTNNNTINDSGDWEGWFTRLGEVLTEELSAQAQGVYSY